MKCLITFYICSYNNICSLLLCRVDFAAAEGKYDLHIQRADLERDNGRFECRLKEDGAGVELYTKAGAHNQSIPEHLSNIIKTFLLVT